MWGANAAHTGTVETTVQPPLREVWPRRRRVDAGVRALVADDRWVVAGCETRRGGSVVALNPATGAQRWQFSLADPVTTTPVLLPDGVCVAAGEGVYRLTVQPDGTVRESARGDAGDAVSSPVYAAGGIFAGTGNGFVYALPAKAEGKWRPAWKKKIADEVQASPAVSEGILYVGGMDGRFYALDARTGEELWKVSTDGPVVGAAAVREGWAFVGSTDGSLYAITAGLSARGGGRVAWRYDLEEPLETTPAVWAGKVFVSTGYRQGGDAGLLVLPVGTHEPAAPLAAWRGTAPPETVAETTSPAVGQNGTVGVGTPGDYDDLLTRRVWAEQPRLYVLRWTGTALDLVADYEFTESSLRAPPVFSGDRLYAAAEDGTVACWTSAEAENEARG
jgi:outer membrane protein assembly factor BamB